MTNYIEDWKPAYKAYKVKYIDPYESFDSNKNWPEVCARLAFQAGWYAKHDYELDKQADQRSLAFQAGWYANHDYEEKRSQDKQAEQYAYQACLDSRSDEVPF